MPLNAATSVELAGEQHLHAWVRTEFGGGISPGPARLVARARQFSSFLLCVGRMSGPNTFQPKHAIFVQNKDEVIIPLLLEQLPTPKEFRDAVRSLSPEQREFARAFRTMQLESSVFAVAVVQLRPQLEGVLNLPPDSLTKEIKLTQDLLELFVEYQIPPDLLSYDGGSDAAVDERRLGREAQAEREAAGSRSINRSIRGDMNHRPFFRSVGSTGRGGPVLWAYCFHCSGLG